jgi:CubicO group peptidase (beta-lactamase class C family)
LNAATPAGATWANWRQAPFNRWAFQHLRELLPTAAVEADASRRWTLPRAPRDLGGLVFDGLDGERLTLHAWLAQSHADGLAILHRGALVAEHYRHGLTPTQPHLVFSITKSITALLVGALAGQGLLDPEAPVTRYLPEVTGGYAGVTLRHCLDMTVSLDFAGSAAEPDSSQGRYWEAVGWSAPRARPQPLDLRRYLAGVPRDPAPHGETFRYITANSDLLGWACERAAGRPLASLLSEHLWRPLGAERDGSITLDRLGAANTGGGFSCTLRDLARVGELLRCRGLAGGRQVVPGWWIDDILAGGDPLPWSRSPDFAPLLPPGARYRGQWYLADAAGSVAMGIGGFSQWLWVDRARAVVVAKLSSRPTPQVGRYHAVEQAAFAAIARAVAS